MEEYNAREVYYAYRVYQHFLIENNLEDDSKSITVSNLMNYVETQIDQDDRDRLMRFARIAY